MLYSLITFSLPLLVALFVVETVVVIIVAVMCAAGAARYPTDTRIKNSTRFHDSTVMCGTVQDLEA